MDGKQAFVLKKATTGTPGVATPATYRRATFGQPGRALRARDTLYQTPPHDQGTASDVSRHDLRETTREEANFF
jgi:hypothetical protein